MKVGTLNLFTVTLTSPVQVIFSVSIKKDFSFTLSFKGVTIYLDNGVLKDIPPELNSGKRTIVFKQLIVTRLYYLVSKVSKLLDQLATSCICVGNHDEHFLSLPNLRKGVLKDRTGILLKTLMWTCNFMSFFSL